MNTENREAGDREGLTQAGFSPCAEIRDLLPLSGSGFQGDSDRSDIEAHLQNCADCRAEAQFVGWLGEFRPEPPTSILRGVLDGAAGREWVRRPRWRSLSWSLSAAAVAILALGVGMFWSPAPAADPLWTLALEPEPTTWYGDEWIVAGGLVPEALSDDMLRSLLQEMDQ